MVCHAARVSRIRQGRRTASIRIEENANRSAVVPCGPMRGNKVLAIAAPSWIEMMATITRATGTRGDREAKSGRVKSQPDRGLPILRGDARKKSRLYGFAHPGMGVS